MATQFATQYLDIPKSFSCRTTWESLLKLATENWSWAGRRNARPLCEFIDMEIVHVCNDGRTSSSWSELSWKPTMHQKHGAKKNRTNDRCVTEVDLGIKSRNVWDIYNSFEDWSIAKDVFAWRQSSPTVNSKGVCLLWFGALSWQSSGLSRFRSRVEEKNSMVHRFSSVSKIKSDWRRTSGTRVEDFPRIHLIGVPSRNPENDGVDKLYTSTSHRPNHLRVDVQWGSERKKSDCIAKAESVASYAKKFSEKKLDSPRTRMWRKMVRNMRLQTR